MEFHQMLKRKGIKVPPLRSIDTSASSPASAEGGRVPQGSVSEGPKSSPNGRLRIPRSLQAPVPWLSDGNVLTN